MIEPAKSDFAAISTKEPPAAAPGHEAPTAAPDSGVVATPQEPPGALLDNEAPLVDNDAPVLPLNEPAAAPLGHQAPTAPLDSEAVTAIQDPPGSLLDNEAPLDRDSSLAPLDEPTAAPSDNPPPATPLAASAPTRSALFETPQMLPGENPRSYQDILAGFCAAVKPQDSIEEVWVHELAEHVWEAKRLRRLKTGLLASTARDELTTILHHYYKPEYVAELAWKWARREKPAIQDVDGMLADVGLTIDAVMAQALSIKIDDIERIDRMIMANEMRRDVTLHEIDRHRATLGQRLRQVVERIEDAEFEEVKAKPVAGENVP